MTTSEFVFGMEKTIDLCYLKLVPDRWQRKLFSRRFLWPGITAYKTNSKNGHLVFSILKKNKKTTESMIFRLYSKDVVNVFAIKTKYHRLCCFLVFS